MPLSFREGIPNLQAHDAAITNPAPIIRGTGDFELLMRHWSWPGPSGKPVYNFRSDEREFPTSRVLILVDGFYEFTKSADPKQKRKDRWLFSDPHCKMLRIAGILREVPELGEQFTTLTTEPGPDVAPYHNRQIAVLSMGDWRNWLDGSNPAKELIRPAPAGMLRFEPAER